MAGGHVLEHLIGIPSSLDYEVTIVLKPSDKGFGFFADIFADTFDNGFVVGGGDDFQSFYGHEGYPCVGVFFHSVGVLTTLNLRFEASKIVKKVEIADQVRNEGYRYTCYRAYDGLAFKSVEALI